VVEQHYVVGLFLFIVDDDRRAALAEGFDDLCRLRPVSTASRTAETVRRPTDAGGRFPMTCCPLCIREASQRLHSR
jgi:hypothetical protein